MWRLLSNKHGTEVVWKMLRANCISLPFRRSHTDTHWDSGPESQSRRLKVGRSLEMSHVVPEALLCACVSTLYVLYVCEFTIGERGSVSLRNCFWNQQLYNMWIYILLSLQLFMFYIYASKYVGCSIILNKDTASHIDSWHERITGESVSQ